jgi:hypothetical protein
MSVLRPYLEGIIDFAGLFPPAALEMLEAVRCFAEYHKGHDSDMLGRFVLPASRLPEFGQAARRYLDRGEKSVPWCLSVLADDDATTVRKAMLEFTAAHTSNSDDGHALCDAVEVRAGDEHQIAEFANTFSHPLKLFFEVSPQSGFERKLKAVRRARAAAKIRTGGTSAQAFPSADTVVRFIAACNDIGVPFKATAGLHHAFGGSYPLTYARNSADGTMFGFLNVLLTSAFIRKGMNEVDARSVLEETSFNAFDFHEAGVSWQGEELNRDDLRMTRSHLFLSFGSCSFTEPVEEARSLALI